MHPLGEEFTYMVKPILVTMTTITSLHAISPHIFLAAMLVPANELHEGSFQPKSNVDTTFHNKLTIGSNVSSMHMLRGLDGKEGAYFVFPDMSVRDEGIYRLNMCLFEIQQ